MAKRMLQVSKASDRVHLTGVKTPATTETVDVPRPEAAIVPTMRVRVLILWGALALGELIVGAIALYEGAFVRDNVEEQLAAQQIEFTPADQLTEQEQNRDPCLTEHGGRLLENGDQARCYANHYILLHMEESAASAGYPDATFATLGTEQRRLRAALQAASQEQKAELQRQLDAVTTLRNTMQTGSTLRGQLLNAWGWDTFGQGVIIGGVVAVLGALLFAALFVFELTRGAAPVRDATSDDARSAVDQR